MNNALLLDLYELTMAQSYSLYKRDTFATFDLFVRALPKHRAYLVACGLESVLNYIKELRFNKEDLGYLRQLGLFSEDFLGYLSRFKFKGDIWAMPEGTVFFADEPVVRITAPIIEAQIIESFLLNTINLQTMIASKASRVMQAAKGRGVYDFSLRRTHGSDAGLKVSRASFLAGFSGTSCVLAGKTYKIPVAGTMAHSFVMTFKHELDSFLAYSNTFPRRTILLVDTYDTKKGIENAIRIGLHLKETKCRLEGIRLDSGNITALSKLARRALNRAGLNYVKIFASGDLDEFRIKKLLDNGALVDSFGVGTNMGTSADAPSLDVVYKISEFTDEKGDFVPTMKLSSEKITYPGRKQVYRFKDKRDRFIKDILGLEKEKTGGKPLLIKVAEKGRIIYKFPSLEKIRALLENNLSKFPEDIKSVYPRYKYPVIISSQLNKLRHSLAGRLAQGQ
ncbi:MAG: nicotinate phosphoribosyltransferase [Candidatus Omnitrophica bacterium]|nr:nicotinate phosphoribosyltransferase [Candidatus Omnitrophota bacterium]